MRLRAFLPFPLVAVAALLAVGVAPAPGATKEPGRAVVAVDPADPGLMPEARLAALVDRVKAEQQKVRQLEAEFVQHRESAFLMLPQDSRGVFSYVAPDRVRWEYLEPKAISLLITGEEMTTWFHDLKRVDRMKIGRYSNQVLKYLNASSSLDTLLRYFTVTLSYSPRPDEPFRLELAPRYQRVAKRLRGMTLWIDRRLFLPTRVRYVEGDGDVTEYRFEKIRVNATLPPSRFELELPADVEVRTLDLERGMGAP
jgi:outer membrane lipoprotein carrier protein